MNNQQLQQTVDQQLAELEELRNYKGEDKVVPLTEIAEKTKDAVYSVRIKSGINELDNTLDDFVGGELVIVSGLTKGGKTTICQTITSNLSEKGVKSLWFSFEVSTKQFILNFGDIIPEFVFVPSQLKNTTLLWIKSKILEAILKYDIKVVFIDHLGFVADLAHKQDRRIEIDSIVREIKLMAVELDIVVFLVHHIRKIEKGEVPGYEDLKESSAVAQDSDKVLMIWREMEQVKGQRGEFIPTGKTILSVEIDRREGVYKKRIYLVLENNKFVEYSYAPSQPSNFAPNFSNDEIRSHYVDPFE